MWDSFPAARPPWVNAVGADSLERVNRFDRLNRRASAREYRML